MRNLVPSNPLVFQLHFRQNKAPKSFLCSLLIFKPLRGVVAHFQAGRDDFQVNSANMVLSVGLQEYLGSLLLSQEKMGSPFFKFSACFNRIVPE